MNEQGKNARREYMKKWRESNPEKVKQHQATYWERKGKDMAKDKQSDPEALQG